MFCEVSGGPPGGDFHLLSPFPRSLTAQSLFSSDWWFEFLEALGRRTFENLEEERGEAAGRLPAAQVLGYWVHAAGAGMLGPCGVSAGMLRHCSVSAGILGLCGRCWDAGSMQRRWVFLGPGLWNTKRLNGMVWRDGQLWTVWVL